jgi:hypothetical protein
MFYLTDAAIAAGFRYSYLNMIGWIRQPVNRNDNGRAGNRCRVAA